ncbi:MAG: MGMT family protein [Ignavibacteriales bacterium]|nr:MGMT family protein [Ignavibacteriales bacterium]
MKVREKNLQFLYLLLGLNFNNQFGRHCELFHTVQPVHTNSRQNFCKRPEAVRAVANANGMNRISIIIPCHRVIGADGNLTGYGGGLWRKNGCLI